MSEVIKKKESFIGNLIFKNVCESDSDKALLILDREKIRKLFEETDFENKTLEDLR